VGQHSGRTRETYRYHDLWRTFLAAELRRTDAELERELYAVAARFHEQRGEGLLEALRLAEPLDLPIPFLAEEQRLDLLHAGRGRFGRHESFVQQLLARHTRPSRSRAAAASSDATLASSTPRAAHAGPGPAGGA